MLTCFHRSHYFACKYAATTTAGQVPGLRISNQTARNRLREAGIRPYRPKFGPVLQPQHQQRRLQWCNTVWRWNLVNFRRIWFSDESRFLLELRDGRQRVCRRERFAPNCVRQVDRYGGGSVMVWGAMSFNGRSELVVVQGTLTANPIHRSNFATPPPSNFESPEGDFSTRQRSTTHSSCNM